MAKLWPVARPGGAQLFLTGRSAEKIGPLADELNARYGVWTYG